MKRLAFCMILLSTIALAGTVWAGDEKAEPLCLELDLVDGSLIIGIPGIESVPLQTSYAKMDIQLKLIRAIKIAEDHENVSIDLRNGDNLRGTIKMDPIKLETVFGSIKIGLEHIRALAVVVNGMPQGAQVFSGHHYLMVLNNLPWHQAKEACEKAGGHLAIITSKEENDFVENMAGRQAVWLGLTDEKTAGDWRWVDGSRVTFAHWASGEPNNPGVEHYVGFYGKAGGWNDFPATFAEITGYICEWDK